LNFIVLASEFGKTKRTLSNLAAVAAHCTENFAGGIICIPFFPPRPRRPRQLAVERFFADRGQNATYGLVTNDVRAFGDWHVPNVPYLSNLFPCDQDSRARARWRTHTCVCLLKRFGKVRRLVVSGFPPVV
jgi:hypothetical protein